ALYKHYPDFHLDVVSGVSIGAINAGVLVGANQDPVGTLSSSGGKTLQSWIGPWQRGKYNPTSPPFGALQACPRYDPTSSWPHSWPPVSMIPRRFVRP